MLLSLDRATTNPIQMTIEGGLAGPEHHFFHGDRIRFSLSEWHRLSRSEKCHARRVLQQPDE